MTSNRRIYVIAEAGVNHNGDPTTARSLVEAAAASGADAIKFQSFHSELLTTVDSPLADYQKSRMLSSTTQFEMLKGLELSHELQRELHTLAQHHGIDFLSTPFDEVSLRFLTTELGISTIKIPSGEITNAPFLLEVARAADRVILSTGGSSLDEVRDAISVISFGFTNAHANPSSRKLRKSLTRNQRQEIRNRVTILHAVTAYPAPISETNLLALPVLAEEFGCVVGLSDHTSGFEASIMAVGLGARVIEKHFTLDRSMPGPDHAASLNSEELSEFVGSLRSATTALGDGVKRAQPSELSNRVAARRALVAIQPIEKGDVFTVANLGTRRPANGRPPLDYWQILGTNSPRNYKPNEPID